MADLFFSSGAGKKVMCRALNAPAGGQAKPNTGLHFIALNGRNPNKMDVYLRLCFGVGLTPPWQRDKHEQFTTLHLFLCRQVSKGELSRKYFAGHVCIVYCSSTTICFALFASSGRSTTYLLCRVLADACGLLY